LALALNSFLAFIALNWGLRVDLWRWDRPFYPALMLALVGLPVAIGYALSRTKPTEALQRLVLWNCAAWLCIAAYVAFTYGWLPQPVYEAWQQQI
jgi:hypothetical protein